MRRLLVACGVMAALGCGHGGSSGNKGGNGGSGPGAGGTTGSGGTGGCATGSEGCACYGNGTCNGSLQCFSQLCVSLTGTGGSATGTAGTTGTGGSASGTAGTTGTGGSASGTAGTTGTGGSSAGTGGSASGTAGTTGTGGSASGTAGTTGTGGSSAGRGGTTGTAGTSGGGTSGNTLTFVAGTVMSGSNPFQISGSAYTFSDGAGSTITPNCSSDTCFAPVNGTGPLCVTGTGTRVLLNTSTGEYDYATYWGAAMALDLNNPNDLATAKPLYAATSHGVTGFQFSFSNAGSGTVRLTYKVRDPGTNQLLDYCLDLSTSTSTIHFSDARLSCYQGGATPTLTAALADRIESIQWMVPTTASGSVPFNYCVSNITPLTN